MIDLSLALGLFLAIGVLAVDLFIVGREIIREKTVKLASSAVRREDTS